jgi:hypothetical protein
MLVIDVGRDNHAAASDFVAYQLRGDVLAAGNVFDFLGNHALTGIVHLGANRIVPAPGYPIGAHWRLLKM